LVSGLCAIGAAASLYGLKGWILHQLSTSNKKAKKPVSLAELHTEAHRVPSSQVIASAVLLLALIFLAVNVWRGRSWTRWGVILMWVLATFTGTLAGLSSLVSIGASIPLALKVPSAISAALLVVAAIAVMRPSARAYLDFGRPERPARPGRGGGLFGPRFPARTTPTSPATKGVDLSKGVDNVQRPGVTEKKRADAEAIAKGAALARSRAKAASKSRRMED
jgi:hypothetical protein